MKSLGPRASVGARILMAVAALSFAVASLIHFGVDVPLGFTTVRDPFDGAAPPEAVIGAVMAIGAVFGRHRGVALGVTVFATLGTVLGLTITVASGRTGDIAYHVSILGTLVVIIALLIRTGRRTPPAERDRERRASPSRG
ncbi:hypothetical protein [Actinoplanes sp. NPDC051411]|uniref:hypothetical protein n=1 Tax=Actinoplanes sp. NPDC051411 TaxID=3155522 RepID=UPI0034319C58